MNFYYIAYKTIWYAAMICLIVLSLAGMNLPNISDWSFAGWTLNMFLSCLIFSYGVAEDFGKYI